MIEQEQRIILLRINPARFDALVRVSIKRKTSVSELLSPYIDAGLSLLDDEAVGAVIERKHDVEEKLSRGGPGTRRLGT